MSEANREMPRYQSHKIVHALKIKEVIVHDPPEDGKFEGAHLMPEDSERYAPIPVDAAWYCKHEPSGAGYYVVYPDGYKSWSPVEAFEEGYISLDIPEVGDRMLRWFAYNHLPENLQAVSRPFSNLAVSLVRACEPSPERTVALRKLLEAKDAAVRAKLNPGG